MKIDKRVKWNKVEINYIIKNYKKISCKEMGNFLNKNQKNVYSKIYSLKLKKGFNKNSGKYFRDSEHRRIQSLKKIGYLNVLFGKESSRKGKNRFGYNKEIIYDLYWNKKLSINKISKMYKTTDANIYKFMKIMNIQRRSLKETQKGLNKGRKFTDEQKNKMSESRKGKILTENHKKNIRNATILRFLKNPEEHPNRKLAKSNRLTNIEKIVNTKLVDLNFKENIDFFFNKLIRIKNKNLYPDFLIFDKFIIECDGDYWHKDKERDYNRDQLLIEEKYRILRLPEIEIKNDNLLSKKIKDFIIEDQLKQEE